MIRATQDDKELVVKILSASFAENNSANYIIKQDKQKAGRLQRLMAYSFDLSFAYGDVFLSDDRTGCALLLFPEKQKTTARTIWWNLKLVKNCIGIQNLGKAIHRERALKKRQPAGPFYYLWYIGVLPVHQKSGIGSRLLAGVLAEADRLGRPVCLETSTAERLPWYRANGFCIYDRLALPFTLYFLRRNGVTTAHTPTGP